MITTAFVYFAVFVLTAVLVLLTPFQDSGGFPADVDTAMEGLSVYLGYAGVFIPLPVLSNIITLAVGLEISILTFRIIRWVFSFVPIVGGRAS